MRNIGDVYFQQAVEQKGVLYLDTGHYRLNHESMQFQKVVSQEKDEMVDYMEDRNDIVIPEKTEVFVLGKNAFIEFVGENNYKVLELFGKSEKKMNTIIEGLYSWCYTAKGKGKLMLQVFDTIKVYSQLEEKSSKMQGNIVTSYKTGRNKMDIYSEIS